MDGKLTIARTREGRIEITVHDAATRKVLVEVDIAPEEFALAVTGLGYQSCGYKAPGKAE